MRCVRRCAPAPHAVKTACFLEIPVFSNSAARLARTGDQSNPGVSSRLSPPRRIANSIPRRLSQFSLALRRITTRPSGSLRQRCAVRARRTQIVSMLSPIAFMVVRGWVALASPTLSRRPLAFLPLAPVDASVGHLGLPLRLQSPLRRPKRVLTDLREPVAAITDASTEARLRRLHRRARPPRRRG